MKQKELLHKLRNEIKNLDNQINHRFSINFQNFIMRMVIKMGIKLDTCLPYILSFFFMFYVSSYTKMKNPFTIDIETVKEKVQTMDTSNGYHLEKTSFDYNYNDRKFSHSTKWQVNEYGLYERIVTTYRIDDSIDLMDLDSIFKINKEELDNSLIITNIEVIQKNELKEEDQIYNEDVLIVINSYENDNNTIQRLESTDDYLAGLLAYFFFSFSAGFFVGKIKKIVFKNCIKDELGKLLTKYKIIKYNEQELNELKHILELRKENLSLLETDNNSDIDNSSNDNSNDNIDINNNNNVNNNNNNNSYTYKLGRRC